MKINDAIWGALLLLLADDAPLHELLLQRGLALDVLLPVACLIVGRFGYNAGA